MRQAGTLPQKQDADRFAAYLLTQGISGKVEPVNGQWAIWVHDENLLDRSRQELAQYLQEPGNPRYEAEAQAARLQREAAQKAKAAQKNIVEMRDQWGKPTRRREVTVLLIVASVILTAGSHGWIIEFPTEWLMFDKGKILEGEVWRIFTPMFLHIDFIHLLFNMWWLKDLGSLIEWTIGRWKFVALVLATELMSACAQYYWVGPRFVGMSGVVYGLFGYAWVRGRLDPTCGLYLRPDTIFIMLLWLVICMTNWTGLSVANAGHVGGLAAGVAFGFLHDQFLRARRRK